MYIYIYIYIYDIYESGLNNKLHTIMKVLVIGGSAFMGRGVVETFLKEQHEVSILNRGKTPDPFGNKVKRILVSDRNDREAFRNALKSAGNVNVCVDFSAYIPSHVTDVLTVLHGKVGHYIFISTQAVYQSPFWDKKKKVVEDETYMLQIPQKNRTSYGWDKRGCEELLISSYTTGGFPSTRVRIPIINGANDPTYRLWRYHSWLKSKQPIYLTASENIEGYSCLWSEDVVRGIMKIIKAGSKTFGEVYNFSQNERPHPLKVFKIMASTNKYPNNNNGNDDKLVRILSKDMLKHLTKNEIRKLRGWSFLDGMDASLSIEKAKNELNWEPTKMELFYPKIVDWFETGESDLDTSKAPFNDTKLMEKLDKLYNSNSKV